MRLRVRGVVSSWPSSDMKAAFTRGAASSLGISTGPDFTPSGPTARFRDRVPWRCPSSCGVGGWVAEALANAPLFFALCCRAQRHPRSPTALERPPTRRLPLYKCIIPACAVTLIATLRVMTTHQQARAQTVLHQSTQNITKRCYTNPTVNVVCNKETNKYRIIGCIREKGVCIAWGAPPPRVVEGCMAMCRKMAGC